MISVVIPTFNSQATIKRAILSVINQNYEGEYEVIVVDDASCDDTLTVVKQLNCKEIKVILLSQNSGAGIARNHGLDMALGDYVAFLDADDFWLPDKLVKQLYIFKKFPDIDVVSSGIVYMDTKTPYAKRLKVRVAEGRLNLQYHWKMLYKNPLSTSTVMCRRSAVKNIRFRNLRRRQDWLFWWDLVQSGKQIFLHPEMTAVYDTSVKGLSSNFFKARKYDYAAINFMSGNHILSVFLLLVMALDKLVTKFLLPKYVRSEVIMQLIKHKDKRSNE